MGRRVRSGICILLSVVASATTSCGDGPEQRAAAGGASSGRAGVNAAGAGTSHGGLAGDSGRAGGEPAFASAGEAGMPGIAEGGAAGAGSELNGQAGAEGTPTAGAGGGGGAAHGGGGGAAHGGEGGAAHGGGGGAAHGGEGGAADGGGGAADGGEGGAADGVGHCGDFAALGTAPVSTRALTKVADASWTITQDTAGIAVDANKRVYVAAGDKVYVVDGASVSEYLTINEARSTAGLAPSSIDGFYDMDSAPDGSLFLLTRDGVLRSTTAHAATLWQRTSQTQFLLGVVANNEVAVIRSFDGLFSLNGTAASPLYTSQQLESTTNCATQDLAVSTHGVFLYQPGCNGSSLVRGRSDGSSVERFYEAEPFGINPMNASNFLCAARDPLGGFYVIGDTPDGSRLYHLCEGATRYAGYNQIPTTPTFTEAANGSLKFRYCSLVAASDGTVFIQSYNQLWRVTPP
ncbi:MAG TPA: hypothetical protein VFK05_38840 [Polyangiaceae bacterium]|nr:hypothetical protein [Polyangiaceae bacterium]